MTDDNPTIRTHMISDLEGEVTVLQAETNKLKEAVVEHRVRLENGVKVFADQKERLEIVEQKLAPSVSKIVGITVAIVVTGAGALWGLANMLRDRPTLNQVEHVLDSHDDFGHTTLRRDVQNIDLEQRRQGAKLDVLLERVPEPK